MRILFSFLHPSFLPVNNKYKRKGFTTLQHLNRLPIQVCCNLNRIAMLSQSNNITIIS